MLQGHFQYGEDNGLPAGHESLKCLSSAMPRWIGDAHWDDKVRSVLETQLPDSCKYNQHEVDVCLQIGLLLLPNEHRAQQGAFNLLRSFDNCHPSADCCVAKQDCAGQKWPSKPSVGTVAALREEGAAQGWGAGQGEATGSVEG